MKPISKIISEELISLLSENDSTYEFFSAEDNIKQEIFSGFLYDNNENFTKSIIWQVIPFNRLKKIWEDYIKMNYVRDIKGLEYIERITIRNVLRISVITSLAGHTQWGDDEAMDDNIGYWVNEQLNCILPVKPVDTSQLEIPYENPNAGYKQKPPVKTEKCEVQIHPFAQEIIKEKTESDDREEARKILRAVMEERFFDYYLTDPKTGQMYISDYGLNALMTLGSELYEETVPEKKVVLIDKILNVVHQRSDIAAWFVQGGSSALSDLSGYEIPDEDSWNSTKSSISGRYQMSDYH